MPRFPWQLKRRVGWAESPGQQQGQAGAGWTRISYPWIAAAQQVDTAEAERQRGSEAERQRGSEADKRRAGGDEGPVPRSHQMPTTPALLILTEAGGVDLCKPGTLHQPPNLYFSFVDKPFSPPPSPASDTLFSSLFSLAGRQSPVASRQQTSLAETRSLTCICLCPPAPDLAPGGRQFFNQNERGPAITQTFSLARPFGCGIVEPKIPKPLRLSCRRWRASRFRRVS